MKPSTKRINLYPLIVIGLILQFSTITPTQAQQPTPDPREAIANKTLDEGRVLFTQGTAESIKAAFGMKLIIAWTVLPSMVLN